MRSNLLLTLSLLVYSFISAQVWQPATQPEFYSDHSFGFTLNGKGYLVTGNTEFEGPVSTFIQYDPESDTWTTLDDFPGGPRGYGIGDVWNGKAYFGFGSSPDEIFNDLWRYDPDSAKWTQLSNCLCDPRLHPTFVAHNGKIFMGLGNNSFGNLKDWWEYDIATDTWEQKPDFPDTRRHHPYMFALGDYIYTGFGHGPAIYNEWYRYDPVAEQWQEVEQLPAEGRVAGTQFSYNGYGYALSGEGEDHRSMDTGEFWQYDPNNDVWIELPPHPGFSRWAPSSFIIDGVVYFLNGSVFNPANGYVFQEESWKFDLNQQTFVRQPKVDPFHVTVWPNPVTDFLNVSIENRQVDNIRIYSMDGKLMFEKGDSNSISVSSLESGLYNLEITSSNETVVKQFTRK